jgi:hypothetical protein
LISGAFDAGIPGARSAPPSCLRMEIPPFADYDSSDGRKPGGRSPLARLMKRLPLTILTSLLGTHFCQAQLVAPLFTPGGGLVGSPALVQLTNPNPSGVIFYTTNGDDPRDPFGNVVRWRADIRDR